MNSYAQRFPDWRPGPGFWAWHGLVPLLCAALLLSTLEHTRLDLLLADRWFVLEGGQWLWRDHWITVDLIHQAGKRLIILVALVALVLRLLAARLAVLRPWRRPLTYFLICIVFIPALIAFGKRFSQVPCPWDLARYGGELLYRHNLEYPLAYRAGGHCFPSGHASGGFALLALYFGVLGRIRHSALLLIPGLVVGWVFALGQQARGAHFLSQDLWTLSLCWFGALLIFAAYRPYLAHWARPMLRPAKTRESTT